MFDEELIYLNKDFENQEKAFAFLSEKLLQIGIVNEEFFQNIKERERIFPTGLRIGEWGIAIPHTDSIYVNRSQIAYVSLITPILFKEMGNADAEVPVRQIFMLALKEAHEQLEVLQKLIEMVQNESYMKRLVSAAEVTEVQEVLRSSGLIK